MSKIGLGATALLLAGIVAVVFLRPEVTAPDEPSGRVGDRGVVGDPAERTGALVDQIVFTQESDAGKVAGLIESGTHHLFGQGVSNTTVFQRLRDSERATYALAYGSSMELTVNPAGPHLASGELNPFHVPEVREALNWLINRRYVAEELYGGLAVPRYLALNTVFPDYARLADVARALELRYQHDPERAARVIGEEMERLGASRENGEWRYQGEPVRVSVLIRTEDARKRVGDYVANLMEDLGFDVERLYRTAEEASRIWIAGDPQAGRWHLYTGGWVSTVINRDLAENFSYYYTPRGRPEPLWQVYAPDPEFDDIADRLQRRDYADWEERQSLMTRALEMSMADSVRIWVVDLLNVFPHSRDIVVAADLAGGISGSRLWPYT
ncbi:MAG: ABC transporter substrate-binding protein, partial [Thioalkalivibrio sp.]